MGLVHFEDGKVLYYPYTPSTTAGYIFMTLFLLITVVHIFQVVRLKTHFFIPMIIGGICNQPQPPQTVSCSQVTPL